MADILNPSVWLEADDDNDSATLPSWPEFMPGKNINNSGRAMMGALKRWANQINATVTSSNSGNNYTLTYSVTPEGPYGGQRFCWKSNAANTGAVNVIVNTTGSKDLKKIVGGAAVELIANDIGLNTIIDMVYISALSAYIWLNPPPTASTGGPIGTHTHTEDQVVGLVADLAAKASNTALAAAIATEVGVNKSASYTLLATDAGKMLTFDGAALQTVTVNTGVFPANSRVDFIRLGAGDVALAGTATRLSNPTGANKLNAQYSGATIWFTSGTTYVLIGDIKV